MSLAQFRTRIAQMQSSGQYLVEESAEKWMGIPDAVVPQNTKVDLDWNGHSRFHGLRHRINQIDTSGFVQ
jgi:hypothetical protein